MTLDDVSVKRTAWREMHKAYAWYQARDERVAQRFADAFWEGLVEIARHPDRWPQYHHGHRYFILKGFPFLLVYRRDFEQIVVTAVAHAKRRPGYWRRRK